MIGKAHYTKNFERLRVANPSMFTEFRTVPLGHTKSELIIGRVKHSGRWKAQSFLISKKENPKVKTELRAKFREIIRKKHG